MSEKETRGGGIGCAFKRVKWLCASPPPIYRVHRTSTPSGTDQLDMALGRDPPPRFFPKPLVVLPRKKKVLESSSQHFIFARKERPNFFFQTKCWWGISTKCHAQLVSAGRHANSMHTLAARHLIEGGFPSMCNTDRCLRMMKVGGVWGWCCRWHS